MALPGTQSYDFLKEKWSGNLRQIHSLIPLIESMLKDKAVYYMLDFETFPSPVVPQQAMHLEQQDRIRYDEAVAKHELRVQENANWEQHHGADFRRLHPGSLSSPIYLFFYRYSFFFNRYRVYIGKFDF